MNILTFIQILTIIKEKKKKSEKIIVKKMLLDLKHKGEMYITVHVVMSDMAYFLSKMSFQPATEDWSDLRCRGQLRAEKPSGEKPRLVPR